jgi:drug/metabolite transporter (DMT)-like permease
MTEAQRKFRAQVILAFALVYVLWGSTYLAIGIAVEHVSPPMMGASRFVTAGALMLLWRKLAGNTISVSLGNLFRLTVIGVLLLCTGNVALGWAERMIPTGLAALLIAVTPLWFLLLESFSHRGERIPPRGILGLVLGLCGVVILIWPKLTAGFSVGQRELLGALIVMFASFSWASGSVLSKRWHIPLDPYTASGWEMLLAGLVNLAFSGLIGDFKHTHWSGSAALAILYLVVAGSWVGFTAYVWLLKNVPISKVATYAYVNPIVAVFLGWLVLHERFDAWMLAGSIVIILGVILVTGAKSVPRDSAAEPLDLPAVESSGD